MEGVFDMFNIPLNKFIEKGEAKISTFEFSSKEDPLYNLRMMMNGGGGMRVEDGKYVRLSIGGELMMSDTDMEKRSNRDFVRNAHGRVLVAGLGIGLIIHNLIASMDNGEVSEVVVIEKSQDLIDLTDTFYKKLPKVKIIQGDIFEWRPAKGEKFNTIYFDIWPDINIDNLEEIKTLHNRFKNFLDRTDPNCWMDSWMDSWMKSCLQSQKRKERSYAEYGW